jgi:hypothetical protein
MVLQKVQCLCFIKYCALIITSFRLNIGTIKVPVVEFNLNVDLPNEVIAAVHGLLSEPYFAMFDQ